MVRHAWYRRLAIIAAYCGMVGKTAPNTCGMLWHGCLAFCSGALMCARSARAPWLTILDQGASS